MKWPPILSILLATFLLLPFDIAHAHGHTHAHERMHTHTHLPPRTSKPNHPDCANLEKLSHTLTRISPILERLLQSDGKSYAQSHSHGHNHTQIHGHSHAHSVKNRNGTQANTPQTQIRNKNVDVSELTEKVQALKEAMERSREKVSVGMFRCQEFNGIGSGNGNATSLESIRRRWLRRRGGDGDAEDDESESDSDSSSSSSSSSSDSDSDSDSDDEEKDAKDEGQCTLVDVLDNLVTSLECLLAFTGGLLDGVLDLVLNMLGGILHLVESSLDS